MKTSLREFVIACAVGFVVLACLAEQTSADTRARQTRPIYVEWGDPDSPAGCRERTARVPGVLSDEESGKGLGVAVAISARDVSSRSRVPSRVERTVRPTRYWVEISGFGIRVRR